MNKLLIILLGLVLLAILGYFCIYKHSPSIQNDIDTRTHATLATHGVESIGIHTDGRDIILTGAVANEEISQQAEQYVRNVRGVNTVDNQLTITGPEVVDKTTPESAKELIDEPEQKEVVQESLAKPKPELEPRLKQEPLPEYTCQQDFDELLSHKKISFATNSADIDTSSNALLRDLIEVTKQCPEANIEIAGHTDSRGRDEYNLQLSQERASSVMNFLINNGVEASRLSAVGYGESNPIADNETPEGLAKNRRIEFNIEGLQR